MTSWFSTGNCDKLLVLFRAKVLTEMDCFMEAHRHFGKLLTRDQLLYPPENDAVKVQTFTIMNISLCTTFWLCLKRI